MKHSILLITLLLVSIPLAAQTNSRLVSNKPSTGYHFWEYTPANNDENEAKPLVVFLHGASLCGKDLNKVRRYGTLHALQMGLQLNAYVVAPQNPGGAWVPDKVNACVDWMIEHHTVDTNRIYVLGMSLGGYGTIDYVASYSHRIAAAMAICGGGHPKSYCSLNDLPLWILHGNADKVVSISQSHTIIERMRQCDDVLPRLIFTELPGADHGYPARLLYLPKTYAWLFEHRLTDYDRRVNRDYDINMNDLRNAYTTLRNSKSAKNNTIDLDNNQPDKSATPVAKKDNTVKKEKIKQEPNKTATVHRVKRGDTLSKIAVMYGTTVNKLCKLNNITQETTIYPGQKLKIR